MYKLPTNVDNDFVVAPNYAAVDYVQLPHLTQDKESQSSWVPPRYIILPLYPFLELCFLGSN